MRWFREWKAARRRYSRDEEIRLLQLRIDRLEAENKITTEALAQQIEINRRDRERVRAEHLEYARQATTVGQAVPSFVGDGF